MYRPSLQKWICPTCTLENTSSACQACSTSCPPSWVLPLPVHIQNQIWTCSVCTLQNPLSALKCNVCGLARSDSALAASPKLPSLYSTPISASSSLAPAQSLTHSGPSAVYSTSSHSTAHNASLSSGGSLARGMQGVASYLWNKPTNSNHTPARVGSSPSSPALTPALTPATPPIHPLSTPVSGWTMFDDDAVAPAVILPTSTPSSSSSSGSKTSSPTLSPIPSSSSSWFSSLPSSSASSSSSSFKAKVDSDLLDFLGSTPCFSTTSSTSSSLPPASQAFGFLSSSSTSTLWECAWCTFNNVAAKKECVVCAKPRGSGPVRSEGAWNCSLCTLVNDVSASVCSVCGTQKPRVSEEAAAPVTKEDASKADDKEQVYGRVICSRITVVALYYGTLTISSTHLTFVGTKIEEPNNVSDDEENIPLTSHMRCKLSDVRQVVPRRFLLRDAAIEVCLHDNFTFCFSFWPIDDQIAPVISLPLKRESKTDCEAKSSFGSKAESVLSPTTRKKVVTKAVEAERNRVYRVLCSLTELDKRSIDLVDNPLEASCVLEQWQRGNISNYDYLMFLNLLAGRSRNDLAQYPVFPWVLADFGSDTRPDLNNPASFRDLSLPVGALSKDALKEALDRYEALAEQRLATAEAGEVDDNATPPPFMYGSHYSSPGIVLYFLLRKEPYTTLARRQQGGTFDLPNRLFSSVTDTWLLCTLNKGDVKELIPEWYEVDAAEDFLLNKARLDLGKKQDGTRVDHVILPAWAGNSPREFVKFHRRALESEFVSQHLHLWIDLIFGFKQTGRAAFAAKNVFFHLTYAGGIDLDAKTDPMTRQALVDQISLYGQTPRQLLSTPHPARFTVERIGSTDREDQVMPDLNTSADHADRSAFALPAFIANKVSDTVRGAPEIAAAAAGRIRESAFTLGSNLSNRKEGLKHFLRDHVPKKKEKYPASHAQPPGNLTEF